MGSHEDEINKLLEIKTGVSKTIEKKKSASQTIGGEDEELPIEDNPVYGFDRTRKPKTMLSFRKADKTKIHVPYPHILLVHEIGERFINVYTPACIITVEGEKLENIAYRIKRGDLSYIQEGTATAPDGVRVDLIKFDMGKED